MEGGATTWASQVVLVVKNPPVNPGDFRDARSILGWGRAPGGGQGNPLQYSCLENAVNKGDWQGTVHSIAKSQTGLCLHTHTHTHTHTLSSDCFV